MSRLFLFTIILLSIIVEIRAYDPSNVKIKGLRKGECRAWAQFKRKFNKTYPSIQEARHRKFIFISNYRKIVEHNKQYDLNLETFNCTINQFSDLTAFEFQHRFTGFASSDLEKPKVGLKAVGNGKIVTGQRKIIQQAKIWDSIDWRRTAVTSVKKQGVCGSCWAFAAAGALEGQIYVRLRKLLEVSVQFYVDCVRTNTTVGCDGGLMTDTYKYAMANGVVEEKNSPYIDAQSSEGCDKNITKIPIKVVGYMELFRMSEDELQRIVSTIGPVSIAIDARWQSLQFYEAGVYFEPRCESTELNHAVLVVGYGNDKEFGSYWILKNSWGSGWGENGYIRMARNKNNHCGVATMASYPIVSTNL